MAIAVYFHPAAMNTAKYDEIIKLLEDAGAGSPKGRIHHSSFGPAEALMVYDVWESQAAFDAFGETLMPILSKVGVDPGAPEIMPVHKII